MNYITVQVRFEYEVPSTSAFVVLCLLCYSSAVNLVQHSNVPLFPTIGNMSYVLVMIVFIPQLNESNFVDIFITVICKFYIHVDIRLYKYCKKR